eukprot:m.91007 g.91007  ORF g.91007 m.91007 type:complete len:104 (+) comp8484_c0_seq1:1531-1842(+)
MKNNPPPNGSPRKYWSRHVRQMLPYRREDDLHMLARAMYSMLPNAVLPELDEDLDSFWERVSQSHVYWKRLFELCEACDYVGLVAYLGDTIPPEALPRKKRHR